MCIGGVSRGDGALGAFGDVTGFARVCGVGAGVLIGDPGEQLGLVGQQRGVLGGVAAEGRWAQPGEWGGERGDVGDGDRLGRVGGWVGGRPRGTGIGVRHGGLRGWGPGRRPARRAG